VIRVGPAGWSYKDWEGIVYPRPKPKDFHPLHFLAQFFQCLEINSTFYAPARREHAVIWARQVEHLPDFRFTAKLHRDFTHRERADSGEEIRADARRFLEGLEPLRRAGKLAALLVQFPASFHESPASVRRLGRIRSLFGELPLVLEVRHHSWFTPRSLAEVTGQGYSLAHIDLPDAWDHPPPWHEPTAAIGYLRLHGRNSQAWFARDVGRDQKYDYLYSPPEVSALVEKARRIAGGNDETYVVTNNHFSGQAVANGLEILSALRGSKVAAPSALVRAYPELAGCTFPPPDPSGQQEFF